MFFDRIELSRNSWHFKLYTFVFGAPDWTNFCPYFWLVMFAMFACPFVAFYRSVRWLFIALVDAIDWVSERYFDFLIGLVIPEDPLKLPPKRLLELYEESPYNFAKSYHRDVEWAERHLRGRIECDSRYSRRVRRLKELELFKKWVAIHGDGWEQQLKKVRKAAIKAEKREEANEALRREAVAKIRATRRARLGAIANGTKKVAPFVVGAIGLVILYGVLRLVMFVVPHLFSYLKSIDWVLTLKWVGLIVGLCISVVAMLALVIFPIFRLIYRFMPDLDFGFVGRAVRFVGRIIAGGIEYLATPVVSFIEFVVAYFKVFKNNHCPELVWVEDKKQEEPPAQPV